MRLFVSFSFFFAYNVNALSFKKGLQTWNMDGQVMQMSTVMDHVNLGCNMSVNTKDDTVSLSTTRGKFTIKGGIIYDEAQKSIGKSLPQAWICESDTGSRGGQAMFWVSSDSGYLQGSDKRFGKTVNVWSAFKNKHCWAKQNNVKYFLWLGSPVDPKFLNAKESDALPCSEKGISNHYFKSVGMLKLLQERADVEWLISMDISDSYFPLKRFHENHFDKFLNSDAGGADVVAGAMMGSTTTRFLNSAVMGMKNSAWTKQLLAEWFKNRCSAKDQLSLWHSLFKLFKEDRPDFSWNSNSMSNYKSASKYAFSEVHQLVSAEEMTEFDKWRKSGHLVIPIHLPHLTYLPNTGDKDFIGFRANVDRTREPFICHNKNSGFESCNVAKSMCSEEEPKQCTCDV